MTATAETGRALVGTQVRGLSRVERAAAAGVVVLVGLLGVIGAVNSFAAVAMSARRRCTRSKCCL